MKKVQLGPRWLVDHHRVAKVRQAIKAQNQK